MTEIGAYEAKTHLPKLLERVQRGERFIITKHGQPVAELVPVRARDEATVRRALQGMRAIRERLRQRGVRLKDLLEEGERIRDLVHKGHRY